MNILKPLVLAVTCTTKVLANFLPERTQSSTGKGVEALILATTD